MSSRAAAYFLKAGGLRSMLSPSRSDVVSLSLRSFPALTLRCNQQSIRGETGTGGGLWYADRVLAAHLVQFAKAGAYGTALVLGCGGVPFSGFVKSALGWQVVLTDLEHMLPQVRNNVEQNMAALTNALRTRCPESESPKISVKALPFGDVAALEEALGDTLLPSKRHSVHGRQLLVLCSDCVWQNIAHRPLLATISQALRYGHHDMTTSALISFQVRNRIDERRFIRLARSQEFGLEVTQVDLRHTLASVEWPEDVAQASSSGFVDLTEEFKLYKMVAMND